ncbi:MAG TPA: S-adenosylmethionine:tRNA ribosyltransferase-isomerase, partial [Polyangiaceae bacterium]|nr:S-adenosylmethionine:tRNA ribosyltransferase-isomerase [Polyangiaceae bacterium]
MKTADLDYELPEALIAAHPAERRDGARLLIVDGDELRDGRVTELAQLIPAGALLVVNDTRVRRARIFGSRQGSGGRVELLFIRRVSLVAGREHWQAIGRASKPLRVGTRVEWDEVVVEVLEKSTEGTLLVAVDAHGADFEQLLDQRGHLPLPPYMRR